MTEHYQASEVTLWLEKLAEATASNEPIILVTVLETQGSIPRGTGTKMLVTAQECFGTVGGGNLEHQCIAMAKQRLAQQCAAKHHLAQGGDVMSPASAAEILNQANSNTSWQRMTHRFPLGARLGQCCGGVVVMLLEYIDRNNSQWVSQLQAHYGAQQEVLLVTPLHSDASKFIAQPNENQANRKQASLLESGESPWVTTPNHYFVETCVPSSPHIMLFGAGHVGRALVKTLADIDCKISWVDSRAEQFPTELPANTRMIRSDEPEEAVADAPANTFFIVMTHSHQLDQQICENILRRDDVKFCGLIGSLTKKRKFEHRLKARGFNDLEVSRLTCPIGIAGISGKQPAVIAVSVAAQLLTLFVS